MKLTESMIPSVDEPPADRVPPSTVHKALSKRLRSQQPVTRLIAKKAIDVSMSALGTLPPPLGRGASLKATRALTEYLDCTVYAQEPAYDQVLCIGGAVHVSYCNAQKWHREDDKTSGSCPYWYLQSIQTRCNGRAAWRWIHAGRTYRCADGEMWYASCGATTWAHTYTICAIEV